MLELLTAGKPWIFELIFITGPAAMTEGLNPGSLRLQPLSYQAIPYSV